MLLEALLRSCPFVNATPQQKNEKPNTLHIDAHIPLTFSEIAGRTLYRVEHKNVGLESEQQSLTNVLPIWILDPLTNVCDFIFIICFSLSKNFKLNRKIYQNLIKLYFYSIHINRIRMQKHH